jgi:hypothetical protein
VLSRLLGVVIGWLLFLVDALGVDNRMLHSTSSFFPRSAPHAKASALGMTSGSEFMKPSGSVPAIICGSCHLFWDGSVVSVCPRATHVVFYRTVLVAISERVSEQPAEQVPVCC